MSLAVLFGGPSPEHDVSILTGLQAARELQTADHEVAALYWSKAGDWYRVPADAEGEAFLEGLPKGAEALRLQAGADAGFVTAKAGRFAKAVAVEFDVAVNCCHGGPGEDGSLQGALDLARIRYTGPNVANAALGMDKLAFGGVIAAAGLPSLPRVALTDATVDPGFAGPFILKPRFGGSSIGIEVVDSVATAQALLRTSPHLRAGAVLEPYRPQSVDLNIAVRRYPELQLSAIEKPVRGAGSSGILGYADKYVGGQGMVNAPRELPAAVPDVVRDRIHDLAARVAELCGVRGVQRIDFLYEGDDVFVNEINTIPGSLSKHLFVAPEVRFVTLLSDMVAEAQARPAHAWTAAGADGSALRSAGSIAGKLS